MGRVSDEVIWSESGTQFYYSRGPKSGSASKAMAVTPRLRTAWVVSWPLAKATAAQMAGWKSSSWFQFDLKPRMKMVRWSDRTIQSREPEEFGGG